MNNYLSIKKQFESDNVIEKFKELVGDNSTQFMTSVLQVVNENSQLKNATPNSVISAAAMAAVLDMPINNSIGEAYIVPYNRKKGDNQWETLAQFQIGYKGFIKLATNSGAYKKITAIPVHESNFKSWNPLTEDLELDFSVPSSGSVIGYAAYFKLINGMEKTMFKTVEELKAHGKKYSKSFEKKSSQWQTNFPGMCEKTIIKMLISKWGPKSIVMQKAIQADQAVMDNYGDDFSYPDNPTNSETQTHDVNQDFTPHQEIDDEDDVI